MFFIIHNNLNKLRNQTYILQLFKNESVFIEQPDHHELPFLIKKRFELGLIYDFDSTMTLNFKKLQTNKYI